jgi:hypothetical protein
VEVADVAAHRARPDQRDRPAAVASGNVRREKRKSTESLSASTNSTRQDLVTI